MDNGGVHVNPALSSPFVTCQDMGTETHTPVSEAFLEASCNMHTAKKDSPFCGLSVLGRSTEGPASQNSEMGDQISMKEDTHAHDVKGPQQLWQVVSRSCSLMYRPTHFGSKSMRQQLPTSLEQWTTLSKSTQNIAEEVLCVG